MKIERKFSKKLKESFFNLINESYGVSREIYDFVQIRESEVFKEMEYLKEIKEYNQLKILKAMQNNNLCATDFNWTTGYGYGDIGRDKVEAIYTDVFKAQSTLVRPNIVSGTHAISLALLSNLKAGDHLLYITGKPYDTLLKVIGVTGEEPGSMKDIGIEFSYAELENGVVSFENVKEKFQDNTKIVAIQRSTGYSDRRALTIDEIEDAINIVRKINKDVIIFIDNCYGEFTDYKEPLEVGADLMAGSLIKNPGGGLAFSGGYVAGREDLVERCANRLTAPGIGRECGLTFGMTRQILQGLFIAPKVVYDALLGANLVSKCFEKMGFNSIPKSTDKRSDIVTAIELKDRRLVEIFCEAVQDSSPVDSQFTPVAWDMPGYEDQVIMAAGDFIEGSSIELSADGPMREPYYVYFQGGLTYDHVKIAVLNILNKIRESGEFDYEFWRSNKK